MFALFGVFHAYFEQTLHLVYENIDALQYVII